MNSYIGYPLFGGYNNRGNQYGAGMYGDMGNRMGMGMGMMPMRNQYGGGDGSLAGMGPVQRGMYNSFAYKSIAPDGTVLNEDGTPDRRQAGFRNNYGYNGYNNYY